MILYANRIVHHLLFGHHALALQLHGSKVCSGCVCVCVCVRAPWHVHGASVVPSMNPIDLARPDKHAMDSGTPRPKVKSRQLHK